MRPTARALAGAMALQSTYSPAKPTLAAARAVSPAAWGGHTDSSTPASLAASSRPGRGSSPASRARARVSALRPASTHSTRCPTPRSAAATLAPMSPGCSTRMLCSLMA